MTRIINVNSPGKIRNRELRTIAEILRRLGSKSKIDEETKDMSAALVFSLRTIYEGVDTTAKAWEKRGYWMKADRFLREWEWTSFIGENLEDVIRNNAWDLLPRLLVDLIPHTADIQIKVMTRSESTWKGSYSKLITEPIGEMF